MSHDRRGESGSTAVWAALPAFLFAVYPLTLVLGANVGVLPLNPGVIGRAFLIALGATGVLLWALGLLKWDLRARGIWLSWVLLLFSACGLSAEILHGRGATVSVAQPAFAFLYAVLSLTIATVAVRPWRLRARHPLPLLVVAVVLLGLNLYAAARAGMRSDSVAWRRAADAMIEQGTGTTSPAPQAERDIYYIVLDGLGRGDVLREHYNVDLGPFLAFLESKGFYVPANSRSNYSQTFLSLASTLNLAYLDQLASAMGEDSGDRRPLGYLIRQNALMKLAKRAGYTIVGIGSDYVATEHLEAADVCFCDQHGLHEIERAAIAQTPFAAVLPYAWTYGAHRRKVLESLAALERSVEMPHRKLVFAHIVSPHPPFVFSPDGSARPAPARTFTFSDGDHFRGSRAEYTDGYRDQVQFVTRRLTAVIDSLLSRPGPAPAIVLHGDHGPGSMLRWNDPRGTNLRERMAIFSAYLFPGEGEQALEPTTSPVNGARALSRRYLGVDLSPLPNQSFFSTWNRPYDLIPVGADLTALK